MADRQTPRARRLLLLLIVVAVAAALWLWSDRIAPDFWPIDASRVGPNLLASLVQWVIVFVVAVLIYPPTRHAIERWLHGHLTSHFEAMHDKLDHIIEHHPDIPPLPEGKGVPPRRP